MKVIYTVEALHDLDGILRYIEGHYPGIYEAFEGRLRRVVRRIGDWPESVPLIEPFNLRLSFVMAGLVPAMTFRDA
jgi:hypothetical protein